MLTQWDGAWRKQLEEGLVEKMECLDLLRGQHGIVVKFNISGGRLPIFYPDFIIY